MDLKRDRILKDLLLLHYDRCTKAADALIEMCSMSDIPEYESKAGASANYLAIFMALTTNMKPTLTPYEMGQLVESQYTYFKRIMNDDRKA